MNLQEKKKEEEEKKKESGMGSLTGTQPCKVFGCKDVCGSTVLGMLESEGKNGQLDWQAQLLGRVEASTDLRNFLNIDRSGHLCISHLKKRELENKSGRYCMEQSVFNQTLAVSVSVSAQDDIEALGKAHMRTTPSLSNLLRVALGTVPYLSG